MTTTTQRRRPRSARPTAAAALALAALGLILLAAAHHNTNTTAQVARLHPTSSAALNMRPSRGQTTSTPSPAPAGPSTDPTRQTDREDHTRPIHESDRQIQQVLDGTQPADLPSQQEHALVTLAEQILSADLTGTGRSRWPSYFGTVPPAETYSGIHFQAGIARRDDGSDAVIDATLIWAGTSPRGQHLVWQRAVVQLAWDGQAWQPQFIT
jgi:hypothetical protein